MVLDLIIEKMEDLTENVLSVSTGEGMSYLVTNLLNTRHLFIMCVVVISLDDSALW